MRRSQAALRRQVRARGLLPLGVVMNSAVEVYAAVGRRHAVEPPIAGEPGEFPQAQGAHGRPRPSEPAEVLRRRIAQHLEAQVVRQASARNGAGARGEDGKVQKLDVKKGDKVLYGKWSGTEVKIDAKDLLIMKESDIMGIIE